MKRMLLRENDGSIKSKGKSFHFYTKEVKGTLGMVIS